jgi:hypothetical protein
MALPSRSFGRFGRDSSCRGPRLPTRLGVRRASMLFDFVLMSTL